MINLCDYLPPYINDTELRAIETAISAAINDLWDARNSLFAQVYPATATWALSEWEQKVGIASGSNTSEQQRRENIISKLRACRTATVEAVETLAAGYSTGETKITEDFSASTVLIHFYGQRGVPEWYGNAKAAIEAVIPAHLNLTTTVISAFAVNLYLGAALRVGKKISGTSGAADLDSCVMLTDESGVVLVDEGGYVILDGEAVV